MREITPKEQAQLIFDDYYLICMEYTEEIQTSIQAKNCAFACVTRIMMANPHGNPINSDARPTMAFWMEVRNELKSL